MSTNNVKYKKDRIFRVHVSHKGGGVGTGTGFFIEGGKLFLTCFHVAFGSELKNFRASPVFNSVAGNTEHEKLQNYFRDNVLKIEAVAQDGVKFELTLINFDELLDIASLRVKDKKQDLSVIKACDVNLEDLEQGDNVFFGGFPICHGYKDTETPFAVNEGMVSSFPETTVAGDKYKHMQINAISLGGNSGAPLFRVGSDEVIGIVNGNMNWGSDKVAYIEENGMFSKNTLRTPLSITFATSTKLLKKFLPE